jgi:hypothetical protein
LASGHIKLRASRRRPGCPGKEAFRFFFYFLAYGGGGFYEETAEGLRPSGPSGLREIPEVLSNQAIIRKIWAIGPSRR